MNRAPTLKLLVAAALIAPLSASRAIELRLTVTGVLDGQTLSVRHPNGAQVKLRLAGITGGSRAILERLAPPGARGWVVAYAPAPATRPNAATGHVYLCGRAACDTSTTHLNLLLLRAGGAKTDPSTVEAEWRAPFARAEAEARAARRGLWATR